MMRNNSSSIISSLQMDYGGDSDEEESDSKNTSRSNFEEEQVTVKTEVKVEIEASVETKVTSASETEKTLSDTKSDIKKEVEENVPDDVTKSTNEETQDVKQEPEISPAELISDDEDGDTSRDSSQPSRHHHHHHHHHHYSQKLAVAEAVNTDSPSSQGSLKAGRKATRLVSYGPDEDVDEDESSSEEEEVPEPSADNSPELNSADASILSRSVQNMVSDDIKIPPEPPGKCSAELQEMEEKQHSREDHYSYVRQLCRICGLRTQTKYDRALQKKPRQCVHYTDVILRLFDIDITKEGQMYSSTLCDTCANKLRKLRVEATREGGLPCAQIYPTTNSHIWCDYQENLSVAQCSLCSHYLFLGRPGRKRKRHSFTETAAIANCSKTEGGEEAESRSSQWQVLLDEWSRASLKSKF